VILLEKAKSLLQRIRRRSISVSKHKTDYEVPVQGANGRISGEPASLSHLGDGTSVTSTANTTNLAYSQSPMSKDVQPLDFEAELSAEDHFLSNKGMRARGTFQKVDIVRWDHEEEDWSLGKL
jgi:hypothetical protein